MSKSVLKNATTGLAGAIALAGGSQAYGEVVTVTVPTDFSADVNNTPQVVPFDVNGDGTVDFALIAGVTSGTYNGMAYARAYTGIGGYYNASTKSYNQIIGYPGRSYYASRLDAGTAIGPNSPFIYYGKYLAFLASRENGASYGALRNRGFVGFEFLAADGEHFGYIELQSNAVGDGTTPDNYAAGIGFFSAAYETTPDTPILAGAVPEPTSLAALAFGAAGVAGAAVYRRKKAGQPAA